MYTLSPVMQSSSRLVKILVLLALLCTAAQPALEAGHIHQIEDSKAACLLCKTPTALPLVSIVSGFALLVFVGMVLRQQRPAELSFRCLSRQTRGPPADS